MNDTNLFNKRINWITVIYSTTNSNKNNNKSEL